VLKEQFEIVSDENLVLEEQYDPDYEENLLIEKDTARKFDSLYTKVKTDCDYAITATTLFCFRRLILACAIAFADHNF